jgi:hypothetical protein
MIIATGTTGNLKWSIIQRNIDGAVTTTSNFASTNQLIFSAGANKSIASKSFDTGHFSVSSGSF